MRINLGNETWGSPNDPWVEVFAPVGDSVLGRAHDDEPLAVAHFADLSVGRTYAAPGCRVETIFGEWELGDEAVMACVSYACDHDVLWTLSDPGDHRTVESGAATSPCVIESMGDARARCEEAALRRMPSTR
jgi:hypothetical protein